MVLIPLIVLLLLILFNGMFAMTEMSVVASRRARLQARAERGSKGAQSALKLADNPTHFLSSVQVGITLIGTLAGAYGEKNLSGAVNQAIDRIPALQPYSEPLSTGLVVIGITYVTLVLGELVPKRLAQLYPERLAERMAGPVSSLSLVMAPFVWALTISTAFILKIIGVKDRDGSEVTQEEVETILAEGTSAGLIEPEEQAMIEEVMRLGDRPVRVAMTPRPEVYWISVDDDAADLKAEIRACPYSRIVATKDSDVDTPLGVLLKNDILDALLDGGPMDLEKMVREPLFIPETTTVLQALEAFKKTPLHMAFVVDEFGGFVGVVTAVDLLEMIAGDFPEDHDEDGNSTHRQREDGSWLIDGRLDVVELSQVLEDDFGQPDGFHTVAGLVLHALSRIPLEGEVFRLGKWRVEVMDMDGRRIDKLLFRLDPSDVDPQDS